MILDTHLHTSEHSPDSAMPVREAVLRAKAMGLDGLCVADHDSMGIVADVAVLRRLRRAVQAVAQLFMRLI